MGMGYFLKRVDKIIRDSWLQNQSIPDSSLKSNIEQQKYKGAKKKWTSAKEPHGWRPKIKMNNYRLTLGNSPTLFPQIFANHCNNSLSNKLRNSKGRQIF